MAVGYKLSDLDWHLKFTNGGRIDRSRLSGPLCAGGLGRDVEVQEADYPL